MARIAHRFNALEDIDTRVTACAPAKRYRVGLYARLSANKGDRGSESIENQMDIMKGFIRENPELSNYREYVDRGISGTRFDRPDFNRMMDDVREGRINCLMVKDMSRFGRDYLETANYIEVILPFMDVRFISVNDSFDTEKNGSTGKELEIALKNLANDMYAKDISKKASTTKQHKMERGKYLGNRVPYGYRVDRDVDPTKYVIDEKPASVIREIFKLAAGDSGLNEIGRILEEKGINSSGIYWKTGHFYHEEGDPETGWTSGTLSTMLRNEAYLGKMVYGKTRTRLYNNEKCHPVDKSEWMVTEDAHEPIVSQELFDMAQRKVRERAERSEFSGKASKEYAEAENRYGGIIHCGICGRRLVINRGWKINKGGKKLYISYKCSNSAGHRRGKPPCISEGRLDQIISEAVRDKVRELTDKKITVKLLEEALANKVRELDRESDKIKKRMARTETDEFDNYTDYALGRITKEEYLERRAVFADRLEKYGKQVDDADEQNRKIRSYMKKRIVTVKELYRANGKGVFEKELLDSLIERIDVMPEKGVRIKWFFENAQSEVTR